MMILQRIQTFAYRSDEAFYCLSSMISISNNMRLSCQNVYTGDDFIKAIDANNALTSKAIDESPNFLPLITFSSLNIAIECCSNAFRSDGRLNSHALFFPFRPTRHQQRAKLCIFFVFVSPLPPPSYPSFKLKTQNYCNSIRLSDSPLTLDYNCHYHGIHCGIDARCGCNAIALNVILAWKFKLNVVFGRFQASELLSQTNQNPHSECV